MAKKHLIMNEGNLIKYNKIKSWLLAKNPEVAKLTDDGIATELLNTYIIANKIQ